MKNPALFIKAYKEEYGVIVRLGMPVLLTQLGIIAMAFADTMMVGAYGTDSLAAAAFVNNFFMVPVVALIGFGAGITPLAGALHASNNSVDMGHLIRVSMQLSVAIAVGIVVIMWILWYYIPMMDQPMELIPLIKDYYLIVLATLIPNAIFNCCQQVANGTTDTAMPMWIILIANSINILGNWLLIFGNLGFPEMGLNGAGLSTLVSRILAAVAIVVLICRRNRYRFYMTTAFRAVSGLRKLRMKVLKTCYPVMLQNGIECLMWSIGAVACGWFGSEELAAYQVTVTISQLGFMTYISFGIALSIRVANMMGTKSFCEIPKVVGAGLHINLLLGTIASLFFGLSGVRIAHLFTDDAAVLSVVALLIAPLILYQYADAIQITYANALRGTSNVSPLLWISVVSYIIVGCPLLVLGGVWMGLKSVGIYYSFSAALATAAFLLIYSFRRTIRQLSA